MRENTANTSHPQIHGSPLRLALADVDDDYMIQGSSNRFKTLLRLRAR